MIRRLSEHLFIQQVKVISNLVDGTFPATYINIAEWERFAILVSVGASDDTSVTCQVVQATSSTGTGKKNITGAALTSTSLASASGSNKWALIEVDQERLDIANDFNYVSLDLAATGGSSTTIAVFFFGIEPRVKPPTFGSDKAELVYVDG